ncbi:break repair meiotic recombinase recruitment factor 1 isoform X3 [Aphelocoma coerulescens]|uniref:break repair meiotic recombinase recruitment factor 1 isoform X3 n=1 Tax=Aphelocoma coerulescens TaxID=39617 RepID=UPI003604D9EB
MGKRRTHPLPGNRKFHAPKAKRILQEAPGAASSAVPIPSQSNNPDGDPAGMDPQASKNSSGKVDPEGIHVEEHGARASQEGRDKGIGGGRAPGSPKQGISDGMGENHLELPQLGILEADGTGEDELESLKVRILDGAGEDDLESPKPGIWDGAGENGPESPKPAILEVDGAGEEPPASVKHVILDGMRQNYLESSQLGILEGDGAGEEQLKSPQLRIPEADGAGEEQLDSLKLGILDGTGKDQLESPKPRLPEVDGAAEEQLETPTHGILDGAGEECPEGSSPEDTVKDTAPAESSEVPDAEGEGEKGALEEGCGTGIALSMDTGSPDCPRDPQSGGGDTESRNCKSGNAEGGNSSMVTLGLDPAATSTEPQDHQEGTSPELPMEKPFPDAAGQQPWDTRGQIHTRSMGNSPVQPWESSARATEPADATDVIRGLIRELSDLNRLAMGACRGLELLRRQKPRRGRRPVPSGSRWKEG